MRAYVSPSPTRPGDSWLYRELVMEATAATSTTQAPMYSCRNTQTRYSKNKKKTDSFLYMILLRQDRERHRVTEPMYLKHDTKSMFSCEFIRW